MYLPGVQKVEADMLNRDYQDNHDWVLHDKVVDVLFKEWSYPQIDLFADADNWKCPDFASRFFQPGSQGNALLIDWSGKFLYAFPPIQMIPAVLVKLHRFSALKILSPPEWPHQ